MASEVIVWDEFANYDFTLQAPGLIAWKPWTWFGTANVVLNSPLSLVVRLVAASSQLSPAHSLESDRSIAPAKAGALRIAVPRTFGGSALQKLLILPAAW